MYQFLETETLQLIQRALAISIRTAGFVFTINVKRRRAKVLRGKRIRRHYRFNTLLLYGAWVLIGSSVWATTELSRRREIPDSFWGFWVILFLVHILLLIFNHILWRFRSEITIIANSLFRLSEIFEERFAPYWTEAEKQEDHTVGREVRKVVVFFYYISKYAAQPVLCIILPCVYWSEIVLTSLELTRPFEWVTGIALGRRPVIAVILLGIPIYEYLMVSLIWRVNAFCTIMIPFPFYLDYIFRCKINIPPGAGLAETDPHQLRHPRNSIPVVYKNIFLLLQLLQDVSRDFLAFAELIFLIGSSFMLCFFAAYRGPLMERLLAGSGLVIAGGYIGFMLQSIGVGYKQSVDMLQAWRRFYSTGNGNLRRRRQGPGPGKGTEIESQRRVLRSLLPLRVYCGSMYFLDEKAAIVLFHQIIDKSIVLLCTMELSH